MLKRVAIAFFLIFVFYKSYDALRKFILKPSDKDMALISEVLANTFCTAGTVDKINIARKTYATSIVDYTKTMVKQISPQRTMSELASDGMNMGKASVQFFLVFRETIFGLASPSLTSLGYDINRMEKLVQRASDVQLSSLFVSVHSESLKKCTGRNFGDYAAREEALKTIVQVFRSAPH